jgi:hypothetical protein
VFLRSTRERKKELFLIRNYVEKQGTKEEKDAYKQMNLLEFE